MTTANKSNSYDDHKISWFLISLLPILAFLIGAIFFLLLFKEGNKKAEIIFFYTTCTLSLPLVWLCPKFFGSENLAAWGKIQTIGVLLLLFFWSSFSSIAHAIIYFNILAALFLAKVTIPALRGRVAPIGPMANWIIHHFPALLLATSTAAVASASTSPVAKQSTLAHFFIPLVWGAFSIIFLKFLQYSSRMQSYLKLSSKWKSVLAFGVVSFLILITLPGEINNDFYGFSPYVGAAMQVLHGHALLVQVNSQYGAGSIWFLSFIFHLLGGVTWERAALINTSLFICVFIATALLLWSIFKNRFALILGVFIATIFTTWAYMSTIYSAFSLGPLRFGFYIFLLVAVVLRRTYPKHAVLIDWFEALIVGMSATWSAEVSVFLCFTYLALIVCEQRLLKSGWKALFSIVIFWGLLEWRIWSEAGQLAPLSYLWEYIGINVSGIDARGMQPTGTWMPMWIFLTISVYLCWVRVLQKRADSVFVVLVSTFYLSISYFANRSWDSGFACFAPFLSILAVYYLYKIIPEKYFAHGLAFIGLSSAQFLISPMEGVLEPTVWQAGAKSSFILGYSWKLFDKQASLFPEWTNPCVTRSEEIAFMKKYTKDYPEMYLLSSQLGATVSDAEFSVCLNKASAFDLNPIEIVFINRRASEEKAKGAASLTFKDGHFLVIWADFLSKNADQIYTGLVSYDIFKVIQKRYRITPIESAGFFTAVRLRPMNSL